MQVGINMALNAVLHRYRVSALEPESPPSVVRKRHVPCHSKCVIVIETDQAEPYQWLLLVETGALHAEIGRRNDHGA